MQLLSGKDTVAHVSGILHPKYQVHGFSVQLTVRKIYGIDPLGRLDFGGGEYTPAGRKEIPPNHLRFEDKYLWWELTRESYFVECNETLRLAPDQIALIEPEDRLMRAGGWLVPLLVRGQLDPLELMLVVGVAQLRVKENARLARVRLFRIDDMVKSSKTNRKSTPLKRGRAKRK